MVILPGCAFKVHLVDEMTNSAIESLPEATLLKIEWGGKFGLCYSLKEQ